MRWFRFVVSARLVLIRFDDEAEDEDVNEIGDVEADDDVAV
jgi:hypothetical protein